MLAVTSVCAPGAPAQTYKNLYQFTGGADGGQPYSTLLLSAGNLYGTTSTGGAKSGCGTIFQLNIQSRQETVLHTFTGSPADGCQPFAGLIRDSEGNFYGTTITGGANEYGTIFRLDPAGNLTLLHSFSISDGINPECALVRDSSGSLYGTTASGGSVGGGTVFKLDTSGNYTVLHNFAGAGDGSHPMAGLILRDGILYGTTANGGSFEGPQGAGTLFRVDATTGAEKVLHSFGGANDGWYPYAGLIGDQAGNLYGTANQAATAYGTVFQFNIVTGQETVLYAFTGGADGQGPSAPLIRDSQGNLYGTTSVGGTGGDGTVFELDTTGNLTTLHSFAGRPGAVPYSGLTMDAHGNLYGATSGIFTQLFGSVYEIEP